MTIQSIGLGQPYLVLITLASDQELEEGVEVADITSDLEGKLGLANALWGENSYAKVSFKFNIHSQIVRVDSPFEEYYRGATPTWVKADIDLFPVTWEGGETLSITYQDDPPVVVVFSAGTQTSFEVKTTISEAISAAYGVGAPFLAHHSTRGSVTTLAIQTNQAGPDFVLEIAETEGARMLGVAPSQSEVHIGTWTFSDHNRYVKETLVKWQVLDERNNPADYAGLIIVPARGTVRAFADFVSLDRGADASLDLSLVVIPPTYKWEVFAHEIGHNLGLPDLYDEATDDIDLAGEEVGGWDIMSSTGPKHTCAWCKHWRTRDRDGDGNAQGEAWMTEVAVFEPPAPDLSESVDYLVFPSELPFPADNPFTEKFGETRLCHAVRIPIGQGRSVYIENRQEGPLEDPKFGTAQFDQNLPVSPGGIICTDAFDSWSDPIVIPVFRRHVMWVGDDLRPLQAGGDERVVADFSADRKVTVRIKEVLGDVAKVYLVEVTWAGPGGNRECRIDPWDPTPWETPDIWVDTRVDNDWDEYRQSDPAQNPDIPGNPVGNGDRLRVGWPARVYARFHNDGNLPANNVKVEFEVVIPAGMGPVEGFDLGSDVVDIPAGGSALARVDWTPRHNNEQHVCIIARASSGPNEANPYNNEAQENLSEWWMEGESPYAPVVIEYRIANPVAQRAQIRLRARDLPRGWAAGFTQERYSLPMGGTAEGEAVVGADFMAVPFEDLMLEQGEEAPVVSIEAEVLYGCQWVPFGGVSATIRPARKTRIEIVRRPGGPSIELTGVVTGAGKPVRNGQITLRTTFKGKALWMTRVHTDKGGKFEVTVPRPPKLPKSAVAAIEIHLSPMTGYAPCHMAPIKVMFDAKNPKLELPKLELPKPKLPKPKLPIETPGYATRVDLESVIEQLEGELKSKLRRI